MCISKRWKMWEPLYLKYNYFCEFPLLSGSQWTPYFGIWPFKSYLHHRDMDGLNTCRLTHFHALLALAISQWQKLNILHKVRAHKFTELVLFFVRQCRCSHQIRAWPYFSCCKVMFCPLERILGMVFDGKFHKTFEGRSLGFCTMNHRNKNVLKRDILWC